MKNIEVEPDLYQFIASQTQHIGENASQILRRLLAPQMEAAQKRLQPEGVLETAAIEKPEIKPANKQMKEKPEAAEKVKIKVKDVVESSDSGELLSKTLIKTLKDKKSKVDVFLLLLAEMNKQKAIHFNQVLEIKGSNRAYFGPDKQTLLDSGKSTNPKQIPGSNYWVVTNNNTQRKSDLLCKVALRLGYSDMEVEKLGSIL